MSNRQELPAIQKWIQSVITHPEGIEAAMQLPGMKEQINVDVNSLPSVIEPSSKQTSLERLQIYADAYYARLLECLRTEFTTLVHVLGEETFNGFAFGYLKEYPSKSYTLGELGKDFPKFLQETRPREKENDTVDWPEFLIDLATLERTYYEVFDGPGTETTQILRPDDLTDITPESFFDARLIPVECLRLLELRYPVHEFVAGVAHNENPAVPKPSPTFLVITRRDYIVRRVAVSDVEFRLIEELISGTPIGVAIETVANRPEVSQAFLMEHLQKWFHNWTAAAYFQRVEMGDD